MLQDREEELAPEDVVGGGSRKQKAERRYQKVKQSTTSGSHPIAVALLP